MWKLNNLALPAVPSSTQKIGAPLTIVNKNLTNKEPAPFVKINFQSTQQNQGVKHAPLAKKNVAVAVGADNKLTVDVGGIENPSHVVIGGVTFTKAKDPKYPQPGEFV